MAAPSATLEPPQAACREVGRGGLLEGEDAPQVEEGGHACG
jgi:hypothetical protein